MLQKALMVAALDDLAFFHDEDLIGFLDGREAVGDEDGRAARKDLVNRRLDHFLGFRVDVGGGFVEDQDAWVECNHPCKGDQLPLTCAQGRAALLHIVHVPAREVFDEFVGPHDLCRTFGLFQRNARMVQGDILIDRAGKQKDILQDQTHQLPQLTQFVIVDVISIDRDFATVDLVESGQQVDDGRFAGSGRTYECDFLPGLDFEADIPQDPILLGVGKPYLVEGDLHVTAFRRGHQGAFVGDFVILVQNLENPFGTDHAQLQRIELIRQHANRPEKHVDVHEEGHHDPETQVVIEDVSDAVPNKQGLREGGNDFDDGKKDAVRRHRTLIGLFVLAVELLEAVIFDLLAVEDLNGQHARDMLLQKGIHQAHVLPHALKCRFNGVFEDPGRDEQDRHACEDHEGEFPACGKHHREDENQGEQFLENVGNAFAEDVIEGFDVADGPRLEHSHGIFVEKAEVHPRQVVVHLDANVPNDGLPEPSGQGSEQVHDGGAHEQEAQGNQDPCADACDVAFEGWLVENVLKNPGNERGKGCADQRERKHEDKTPFVGTCVGEEPLDQRPVKCRTFDGLRRFFRFCHASFFAPQN